MRRRDFLRAALCLGASSQALALRGDYAFAWPGGHSEALLGQVVWVDFWAAWCQPCQQSFPWMAQMLARYEAEGLAVVTINIDRERALAERFLQQLASPLPVVYDPKMQLYERFGVRALPSSFLFDRQGQLLEKHIGFSPEIFEQSIQGAVQDR